MRILAWPLDNKPYTITQIRKERMAAPKGKGFMAKGPNTIDQRFAERLFKDSRERWDY